jgi:hypothetical protein
VADNTQINATTVPGGDKVRDLDLGGGVKLPVGAISDETGEIFAAVKPASTPAEETDPALVVALRPGDGPVDVIVGNFPTPPTVQPVSATTLPLPTGAATDASITSRLGTLGQKTGAGSTPVVIASDQPALPVSVATLPAVSGTVTANVGTTGGIALDATLTGGTQKAQISDGTNTLGVSAHPVRTDPTGTTTQPVSGTVTANVGTTNGLALDATLTGGTQKAQIYDGTNVIGTAAHPVKTDPTGTTTQPISGTVTSNVGTTGGLALDATLTSGAAKVTATAKTSSTGTPTSVAASITSVTLLANNANRLGATVYNNATSVCYLNHGATSSSALCSFLLQPGMTYEVSSHYTGVISGIWAGASGNAFVTEFT